MPTRIDAELGLSAEKFRRGLAAAGNGLENFTKGGEKQFRRLGLSIDDLQQSNRELRSLIGKSYDIGAISRYNRALQENEAEIKRIAAAAGHATNEINDMGRKGARSFGAANNAAMSFSQIIQDAPYGIRGVANNITQLTTNLGYMAAEAKAAGVSMRTALIGSLANPATIAILAVSGITTAMQLFADRASKAKKETDGLSDSIKSLAGAMAQGSITATKDLTQLDTLYNATQDVTRSIDERRKAVDALQDQYPSYFANVDDEKILIGDASDAYKSLRENIIGAAQAKALMEQVVERERAFLELQPKKLAALEKSTKAQQDLNTYLKIHSATGIPDQGMINHLSMLRGAAASTTAAFQKLVQEGNNLRKESQNFAQQLNNFSVGDILGNKGGNGQDSDVVTAIRGQVTAINSELSRVGQLSGIATNIQTSINNGVQGSMGVVYDQGVGLANAFSEGFAEVLEAGVENTIVNLSAALGGALAAGGNVIAATGSAMLASLGNLLMDLGKMAIAVGVTLKGVRNALFSLNGPAAIAAGVAAVTIGAAFAAKARDLSQSMGGSSSGASSSSAGGGSNVSISSANTSGIQGTVVFEIAGRSLVGVLRREAAHGNRISG